MNAKQTCAIPADPHSATLHFPDLSPKPTRPPTGSIKKLYRMNELIEVVGRCRAAIYMDIKAGRFPAPIRLGPNSSAWLVAEVDEWIARRAAERDQLAS